MAYLADYTLTELGLHCWVCGVMQTKANIAYDHRTPSSRGGQTVAKNIIPMHSTCNRAKGALNASEWAGLATLLLTFPIAVKLSVLRRLRVGWRAGWLVHHAQRDKTTGQGSTEAAAYRRAAPSTS